MKIQFMCRGNKILYCDDEIIRITQEKTLIRAKDVKEAKVSDFSEVIMPNRTSLELYDDYGNHWGEVQYNKRYIKWAEEIVETIKREIEIKKQNPEYNEQDRRLSKDLEFRKFIISHGIEYKEYEQMNKIDREKLLNEYKSNLKVRGIKNIADIFQQVGCLMMLFPVILFLIVLIYVAISSLF